MKPIAATLLCLCLVSPALAGDNRPDYRGPRYDGHTDAAMLPLKWSDTESVVWKTPIHGLGYSSPVIVGHTIWLTTATTDGRQMSAICVDKNTGKILHDIRLLDNAEPEPINPANSYASPSPAIDDQRVYLHFGTYGTICLDRVTGKELWRRTDMKLDHKEGPGSSAFLYGKLLILTLDGMDVQYLAALDVTTGKTVWKTQRTHDLSDRKPDLRKTYSTPTLIEVGGRKMLISQGAFCIYAYDPDTGGEIWRLPTAGFSTVARPHMEDGVLFVNSGFAKPQLWAIRPAGSGTRDETEAIIWKQLKNIPRKPSDVYANGMIFMVDDQGIASCLDAKTGEEIWRERIQAKHSASPLVAPGPDGKPQRIYLFGEDGTCTVLRAAGTYEVIASSKLPSGVFACPAVSGNALFIRTTTHLYRIENP